MDTIFALATVPGKSGVAVVRVSGPAAHESCRAFGFEAPAPRKAVLRKLIHASAGFVDEALILRFSEDASFTGEHAVEFQLHGSVAIIRTVLDCLGQIEGFRSAEAGEFTRRALNNGRLELAQVEALGDLIDAETEQQRRQALDGFSGALRDKAENWRKHLIRAMALLEATMEFSEEDVPEDVSGEVVDLLNSVHSGLQGELAGYGAAERIRTGFEVAIIGAPNVGKSTLLNALAGRQAAITSDIAGTTRDVIEVRMDIGGLAVTFLDTAGLRGTEDQIEQLGVNLARDRAASADLRVLLLGEGEAPDIELLADDIVLQGKGDLTNDPSAISGVTGRGLSELISRIQSVLSCRVGSAGSILKERQKQEAESALISIESAQLLVGRGEDMYDMAAEDIRQAVHRLEVLVGRVDVEHVLDEVFSSFCIGK